jgi:type I restriction-modification system DNA methylase subunit
MVDPKSIEVVIDKIKDQSSFIQDLLIDTLNWPINEDIYRTEDISYEWSSEELRTEGLSDHIVNGKIYQIRPFEGNPWGIFFLEFKNPEVFTSNRGLTGTLRKVLRALVPSKRKNSHLASFDQENLLFICNHDYVHFRFAHFKSPERKNTLPPITTFGWGPGEPKRTLCEFNLSALSWPDADIKEEEWLEKWAHAFDVEKVTKQFYQDYRTIFDRSEILISEKNQTKNVEKNDLRMFTQILFNRLMFLRFVERKGWLEFQDRNDYLLALKQSGPLNNSSFYKSRLWPLFFEGLAISGKQSSDIYGSVPFLNGGLFEITDLDRRFEHVPDEVFEDILSEEGLFYRYNFTVEESTPIDQQVAVDPEMLGKVFEELIIDRQESGAYYTPRAIVSFMCRETLKGYLGGYSDLVDDQNVENISVTKAKELLSKLDKLKVADPACGSGAYLVGMLQELYTLIRLLDTQAKNKSARDDYERKLQIIQSNLYGVDIDPIAIRIARLRMWLSLTVEYQGTDPQPLPNLEFKIETGDSLLASDPKGEDIPSLIRHSLIQEYDGLKNNYQKEIDSTKKKSILNEIEELKKDIRKDMHLDFKSIGFDWRVEFAEVFTREGGSGFDIVIANPPYGAKVGNNVRDIYFDRRVEGAQSKDTYGLFIARGLQLLRSDGQFSFIVSDTWRTLKSFLPLRRRLFNNCSVSHIIELPPWIFDATVNTCILTLQNNKPSKNKQLITGDLENLPKGDWESLSSNLIAISSHSPDVQTPTYARYTYKQSKIADYPNLSFFIASPTIHSTFTEKGYCELGSIADIRVGLQTSDNKYYLRKSPDARGSYDVLDHSKLLTEKEIKSLTEQEKRNGVDPRKYGGRFFLPYDKGGESNSDGGWLPNYHVPTQYFIGWSEEYVDQLKNATVADIKKRQDKNDEIRDEDISKVASRFQNSEYYFKKGISFSRTGFYAPTFRINSSSVFDTEGSSLIPSTQPTEVILGLVSSALIRYMVKNYIDHTVHVQVDDLKEIRLNVNDADLLSDIDGLVKTIIKKQKLDLRYPYHLNEQKKIDKLVFKLFNLSEIEIREVEIWFCRRYERLASAQGNLSEINEKYSDYLERCKYLLQTPPDYWSSHPILRMISQGENSLLEFKQTLNVDMKSGNKSREISNGTLKTIAGFLNTNGGVLLIGVSDLGEIKGLDPDFKYCVHKNKDGFELKIRDLISSNFSPIPMEYVTISFEELPEGLVCKIETRPRKDITHLNEKVFVRDGNSTRELRGSDLTYWLSERIENKKKDAPKKK